MTICGSSQTAYPHLFSLLGHNMEADGEMKRKEASRTSTMSLQDTSFSIEEESGTAQTVAEGNKHKGSKGSDKDETVRSFYGL